MGSAQISSAGSSFSLRRPLLLVFRYVLPFLAGVLVCTAFFVLEISDLDRAQKFLFFGMTLIVGWYALDQHDTNERMIAERHERERAEAALRETQTELLRATRITTVAELMASIAHEVNQPLAAVVANGQAALNWLQHSPPALAEAKESMTAVVVAGERAAQVLGRIRNLMTRGASLLTDVDVNELINEAVSLVQAQLTKMDIVVRIRFAAELPSVSGDRIQLQQLVLNLINNAGDAMADVTERPRKLAIETRFSDRGRVKITISDTGHGFADPNMEKLFQPFYSTKQDGMGMGLAICRTIVTSHGGSIRARSGLPHGAVFEVDLPARSAS
jgi:C4-dicarboxylate-specific signal transduction histidine kinase